MTDQLKQALIAAKCCTPDGSYVHASMSEGLAALPPDDGRRG